MTRSLTIRLHLAWLRLRRHLRSVEPTPLGARGLTARVAVILHGGVPAPAGAPAFVARLAVPGRWRGRIERAGRLDPYLLEAIHDEARAAGPTARLEIVLAPAATDADVAWVRAKFATLTARGVRVDARRASVPPSRRGVRAA